MTTADEKRVIEGAVLDPRWVDCYARASERRRARGWRRRRHDSQARSRWSQRTLVLIFSTVGVVAAVVVALVS